MLSSTTLSAMLESLELQSKWATCREGLVLRVNLATKT